MIILLNSNLKGGVSKSVNNVMITNELAERGYRVLFLDLDPQMSSTRFLTQKDYSDSLFQERNIYHVINQDQIESNIIQLNHYIDYIPGSPYVNLFENILSEKGIKKKKHLYFRILFQQLSQNGIYDFIVMDTSPSKSFLNLAANASATHHMITTMPEALSFEKSVEYYEDILDLQNEGIESEILGVSISITERTKFNRQMSEAIREYFGELVFETEIKKRSKVQEYIVQGLPKKNRKGHYYVRDKQVMSMYKELTEEVLKRLGLPMRKDGK